MCRQKTEYRDHSGEEDTEEDSSENEEDGLLDSGATHAMRPREETDQGIKEVKVELAGNMTMELRMHDVDTVLGGKGARVIVPFIPSVKHLTCKIRTSKDGKFQVIHPVRGMLPIDDSSGTPLIPRRQCKLLIAELEKEV